MLTQMVEQLIQQDPTLLAQRTVDTRRYIMDQWDHTHRDPIDENALAVFLCDEAHSSLPEEQKIFAREKRAEVRETDEYPRRCGTFADAITDLGGT